MVNVLNKFSVMFFCENPTVERLTERCTDFVREIEVIPIQ